MPRHQLTLEERRRGGKAAMEKLKASGKSHRFTLEDCLRGAWAINHRMFPIKRHLFTTEERRRGGLKRQANRRQDLALMVGDDLSTSPPSGPLIRADPIDKALLRVGEALGVKEDVKAVLEGPPEVAAMTAALEAAPDPFTMSALQRFRLGPKTPFELKRSERAQLDLLRAGGWVEGGELISLTEKGRKALESVVRERRTMNAKVVGRVNLYDKRRILPLFPPLVSLAKRVGNCLVCSGGFTPASEAERLYWEEGFMAMCACGHNGQYHLPENSENLKPALGSPCRRCLGAML